MYSLTYPFLRFKVKSVLLFSSLFLLQSPLPEYTENLISIVSYSLRVFPVLLRWTCSPAPGSGDHTFALKFSSQPHPVMECLSVCQTFSFLYLKYFSKFHLFQGIFLECWKGHSVCYLSSIPYMYLIFTFDNFIPFFPLLPYNRYQELIWFILTRIWWS